MSPPRSALFSDYCLYIKKKPFAAAQIKRRDRKNKTKNMEDICIIVYIFKKKRKPLGIHGTRQKNLELGDKFGGKKLHGRGREW